jgi:hypothetical protein
MYVAALKKKHLHVHYLNIYTVLFFQKKYGLAHYERKDASSTREDVCHVWSGSVSRGLTIGVERRERVRGAGARNCGNPTETELTADRRRRRDSRCRGAGCGGGRHITWTWPAPRGTWDVGVRARTS